MDTRGEVDSVTAGRWFAQVVRLTADHAAVSNALRNLLAQVRLKGHCPSEGIEPCPLCRAIAEAEKALEG